MHIVKTGKETGQEAEGITIIELGVSGRANRPLPSLQSCEGDQAKFHLHPRRTNTTNDANTTTRVSFVGVGLFVLVR